MNMYCAKQRALPPSSTRWPATEQPGIETVEGVNVSPAALNCATSFFWPALIAATSALIAGESDAMSGVPVIC
jgi:hypothetical protein